MLNLNGLTHLDASLSSLEAQTYPKDRFDAVLVDNGSTDASIPFVRERSGGLGVEPADPAARSRTRVCRQRAMRHRGEQMHCERRPVRGRPQTAHRPACAASSVSRGDPGAHWIVNPGGCVARHQETQKFGPAAVPDLPDRIGSVPSEADLPGNAAGRRATFLGAVSPVGGFLQRVR